jgi:hypothetical protein
MLPLPSPPLPLRPPALPCCCASVDACHAPRAHAFHLEEPELEPEPEPEPRQNLCRTTKQAESAAWHHHHVKTQPPHRRRINHTLRLFHFEVVTGAMPLITVRRLVNATTTASILMSLTHLGSLAMATLRSATPFRAIRRHIFQPGVSVSNDDMARGGRGRASGPATRGGCTLAGRVSSVGVTS